MTSAEHDPAKPIPEPKPRPKPEPEKPDDANPEPREDGRCVECERAFAKTRDGLLCMGCLRAWAKWQNERNSISKWREHTDRPARDNKALGGCAEMGSDGDDW